MTMAPVGDGVATRGVDGFGCQIVAHAKTRRREGGWTVLYRDRFRYGAGLANK